MAVQLQSNLASIRVYSWEPFGAAILPDSYTQQVQVAAVDAYDWSDITVNREDPAANPGPSRT